MDRQTDRWTDKTDRQTDIWTDKSDKLTDGQTRQTDKPTNQIILANFNLNQLVLTVCTQTHTANFSKNNTEKC